MVGRRVHPALLLLLFFAPLAVSAQSAEPSSGGQEALFLYVDQPQKGMLTEDQLLVLSRSLLISLQAGVPGLPVSDAAGPVPSASPAALSDLAVKTGADFWIWAQVSIDAGKTQLHVRGFDVRAQEMKFDTTLTRESDLSPSELPFEKWNDVVSLVTSSLSSGELQGQGTPGPQEVTLTVRALPGTLITGPGGTRAQAGKDGFALLSFPAPGEYSLHATLSGYYPLTSRFFLGGDREVFLEQTPASWWAIDASLLEMGYPSFDVSRFIIPNSLYVKLGITTYAVGLALTDTQAFTSNPLTNLVLQTGIYLGPEDMLLRPYVNLGAFLRIVVAPGTLVGIDPLSWGGLQFSIGTEIGRSPRGRFFFEYQPMFYAVSVPGLFQASFGSGNPPSGWSFSQNGAANYLCFRTGYRWAL